MYFQPNILFSQAKCVQHHQTKNFRSGGVRTTTFQVANGLSWCHNYIGVNITLHYAIDDVLQLSTWADKILQPFQPCDELAQSLAASKPKFHGSKFDGRVRSCRSRFAGIQLFHDRLNGMQLLQNQDGPRRWQMMMFQTSQMSFLSLLLVRLLHVVCRGFSNVICFKTGRLMYRQSDFALFYFGCSNFLILMP